MRIGVGAPVVFASNFRGDVHDYRHRPAGQRSPSDRLAALGWEVIHHDGRGMGASDRAVTDWSLEGRVRDLEAVMSRVNAERVVLAGVDQGAPAAIAYAARHKERVSRLLLICPFASGAARYALPALQLAMSGTANAGPAWGLLTNVIGHVVTQFSNPALGRQIADSIRDSMTAEGLAAYFAASRAIDVRHALRDIAAPTLVLHDPTFPFGSLELCRDVASGIPDARLLVVNDGVMMGGSCNETLPAIDRFLRQEMDAGHEPARVAADRESPLTPRELEVLRLVATGRPNKAIGLALGMGERTVARHITNIYAKIGTSTRSEATAYAIRNGLT